MWNIQSMCLQFTVWTSLPDQHSTVNSSQLTHRLLDVPVNVKSDQQTRRHQQVLQDDDHCELPRALAPVDHAASVSIHPPPVHQVLWVSCRSSARLSTRVGKKRGREQWLTEKKPLVIYTLFCLCVCGWSGVTHTCARARTQHEGEAGVRPAHRELIGWQCAPLQRRSLRCRWRIKNPCETAHIMYAWITVMFPYDSWGGVRTQKWSCDIKF